MDKADGRTFDELVVRAKGICGNPRLVAIALTSDSPTMAGKRAVRAGLTNDEVKAVADLARISKRFPEQLMKLWEEAKMSGKHDFTKEDVGHWSIQMDLEVAMEHFAFVVSVIQWIQTTGQELLKKEAATYQEWEELLRHAYYLWRDFHGCKPVDFFFTQVVERGIDWLIAFANSGGGPETIHMWFRADILYQLGAGARLGIGGETCTAEKTRELVLKLVPLVQAMKDECALKDLARILYCRDPLGQEGFIATFKNW